MSEDSPDKSAPITRPGTEPATRSAPQEIAAFLDKAAALPAEGVRRGRLVFALDATLSRQPTWDRAQHLQAEMFEEAARIGTLNVQLVYFRGFGECRASRFVADTRSLARLMAGIDCRGGRTQIERVLRHALATTREERVDALVYVGDAMEERADDLCAAAGELAIHGTRLFLFQEGEDPAVSRTFAEMARLSGGAHVRFDAGAAARMAELLRAVGAYAAGGLDALERLGTTNAEARALLSQLK
ncbi:VWA domain-containing protein [Chthonobacter albigriseus]|uniref:VWA domain-containing protein n=1 Tax=Chthonobacter albigriseus TaxID=1683161 RepID=UPI0015EFD228|nr:VWA domain-containing protein [Chthonobacter albigriseus]